MTTDGKQRQQLLLDPEVRRMLKQIAFDRGQTISQVASKGIQMYYALLYKKK